MATEHEYKYVLSLELAKQKVLWHGLLQISQGYLAFSKGMTTRIRHTEGNGKSHWCLTFKQKVKERVVEIEKSVSKRDGRDLWDVCVGKLKKCRHLYDHKGITWEVDFFYKGDHLYFIMAEVELDEGAPRPKNVPDFMKKHILHEVELTDDRFSNKRLGDVDYATAIYHELQGTKK